MLCALCSSVGRMRTNPGDELRTRRGSAGPPSDGSSETCDACGHLVAVGAGEGVVETLAHLARFGLTGQAILTRKRA